MGVSVVAIDGVGRETQDYIELLRTSARVTKAEKALLLTSDANARDNEVSCVVVEPLDYFGYSRFCVESLHQYVESDFALCVQLDGFVLNPERFEPEFFEYDYVGAPWRSRAERPVSPGRNVGNGGFSLRSKAFLKASSELTWTRDWQGITLPQRYWGNEDYFLCVLKRAELEAKGLRFAPQDVAARFSVQWGDQLHAKHDFKHVLGFHGKPLMGKARRYAERRGLLYPHLEKVAKSLFPWSY